ncbi:cytochrome P450 (plasmid) [Azospirillum sp. B510]|uniref:cytochrome P450 n=1 Tax=Azospirillum sp. (strain B510) TaxID=137722 RepID=UPI0001C4CA4B|nr:cytochrome P450 [Azospirillum sp. B510]BAI75279.1 cytochrome P450 [Azospirillum sp. B510]
MAESAEQGPYVDANAIFRRVPAPPHIPADRMIDFDYRHPAGLEEGDVYTALKRLQDGPEIAWTPHNGGHWIVTRGEDIKWVQETYEIFSHEEFTIPRGAAPIKMPPLTTDPPDHGRFRSVLNPAFTPVQVNKMRDKARTLAIDLIESLRPEGTCEFVGDFARVMPVTVFLGIVDLPLDRREEFVEWALTFMVADDMADRLAAQGKIVAYLRTVLDERERNPGDDLLSRIVAWRKDPRFGGEHEVMGMALLVFFGGLDTVASMLSFVAHHLASHPGHVRRLREEPGIIPRAATEYLRRFGLSNTGRLIKKDTTYKGVTFLKDEMIMVPIGLSSIDDRLYDDPFTVNFDREVSVLNTFGNGPHRCAGAPLARVELEIFLAEWTSRMPDIRLDPDRPAITHAGVVNGVERLHLLWDV